MAPRLGHRRWKSGTPPPAFFPGADPHRLSARQLCAQPPSPEERGFLPACPRPRRPGRAGKAHGAGGSQAPREGLSQPLPLPAPAPNARNRNHNRHNNVNLLELFGRQAFPPWILLNPKLGGRSHWRDEETEANGPPRLLGSARLIPRCTSTLPPARSPLRASRPHSTSSGAPTGSQVSRKRRSPGAARWARIPLWASAGSPDPVVEERERKGPGLPSWVTSPEPTELGTRTPG